MNILKEAVITSRFLKIKKDINDFFIDIVVPSGYTYFEWENFIYKVKFDDDNNPKFSPTGKFYDSV